MKKFMVLIISLMSFFILSSCTTTNNSSLQGFYQSERTTDGYVIQISIQSDENSFVQYIDNREVDSGTYQETENNVYKLESDTQKFEITLSTEDSFEIIIDKMNNGEPIKLYKVDDIPTYFETEFDDIEKYKELIK